MIALLIVYLIGVGLLALSGLIMWFLYYDVSDKRTAARLLFLAPAWPALVVPAIRVLWADAGWGKGER